MWPFKRKGPDHEPPRGDYAPPKEPPKYQHRRVTGSAGGEQEAVRNADPTFSEIMDRTLDEVTIGREDYDQLLMTTYASGLPGRCQAGDALMIEGKLRTVVKGKHDIETDAYCLWLR